MSVEEEIELKDLIAQTLNTNGTLAKIKAQLRASIFLALDEDEKISKYQPLLNNKIKTFMESSDGKSMFYLVHEFLEFFNLCFTLAVYEPESYIDCDCQREEKQRIAQQFGLKTSEDNSEPLLYQILKIAQKSRRNLEVNINVNGNIEDNKSDSISSEIKSISTPGNICSGNNSEEHSKVSLEIPNGLRQTNLNCTFDVLSPILNPKHSSRSHNENDLSSAQKDTSKKLDSTHNNKESDDTYDDTSSLPEDLVQTDQEIVPEIKQNGLFETEKENISDKLKLSSLKSDKLKSKSNLSSLSDLPPLNKSRVNDILPSLYNKGFKDKSNLRELDKLFDTDADYEEDFMYSGDDLSLKSDHNKASLLEELQQSNKTNNNNEKTGKKETKVKSHNKIISDCNKSPFKSQGNPQKSKNVSESSTDNSIISENLGSTSQ
ncbi:uncharacterized protein [Diabrotica undecimpunctata]|uniref:uncharacterized protein n=1 Tax=Diabrotica undecimpunctata TaxID=50387 RepID=UPI003B6356F0